MRHVLFAVLFAGLAACSPEATAPEPADAPAALPPGRPAIYEAARVGPEEFVRALYAVYATPGASMGEPPRPGQDPIYDRMLNAMIGADFAQAAGEVPTLNYDPICDCQDSGDFTLDSVTVTQSGPAAAEAAVVFTNLGETKRQTLKLVKEGPMWKVSDVLVPGRPPLTEQLMAAIS
ncbi:MAG: YbjP/YqhG family protein [Alphaproteobacteria bacterium]|nr:YbjP/YqhG family protein [Alphaproteobacteria bacterium]MBU4038716.1 YbjP/YqhG family protein [Alphaproteobacteria bacterium]MBU4135737.1 YbjP/YqhG family protein [Alphaproteobacteria bacterium]